MHSIAIREGMRVIKLKHCFLINCNDNGTRFVMYVVFTRGWSKKQNVKKCHVSCNHNGTVLSFFNESIAVYFAPPPELTL